MQILWLGVIMVSQAANAPPNDEKIFMKTSVFSLKTLTMTAILPFALTGCITINPANNAESPKIQVQSASQNTQTAATNYSRFDQRRQAVIIAYQCNENATMIAQHGSDGHILKVNAPSWQINNQDIRFTIDSSSIGSQNGTRYTNNTNPNSLYEWRVKGNNGILSVKIQNDLYRISCQAKPV